MHPYQERVVHEKEELDEKLSKLRLFFTSSIFSGLTEDEQERLRVQENAMDKYSQVLGERLAHFA